MKRPHPFCSETSAPEVLQPQGKCHGRRGLCLAVLSHVEGTGGRSLSLTLHNYALKSSQEFPYSMIARWKSTPLLPALKTTPLLLPLLLFICFPSMGEPADEGSVPCWDCQAMDTQLSSLALFLLRFSGFVSPKCQGRLSPQLMEHPPVTGSVTNCAHRVPSALGSVPLKSEYSPAEHT